MSVQSLWKLVGVYINTYIAKKKKKRIYQEPKTTADINSWISLLEFIRRER